ncbi:hypothetical protein PTE30175_05203 [Pandoraea terrae]|uniref:Uncharacterized protein n=1 Tax=Pandoraea terrae TaxID=1537710 RepID=A0A5E4ZB19_9BURK|nr:hypothetical protein PTE30175_05203 [Pandoraea terrae]
MNTLWDCVLPVLCVASFVPTRVWFRVLGL